LEGSGEREPGVAPELLSRDIDRVVEEIYAHVVKLKAVRGLSEGLRASGLVGRAGLGRPCCFYAVDSSFTAPPIEIAGGYLGVIQVAELVSGGSCTGSHRLRAYVEYHPNRDLTSVKARLYERMALLHALEARRRGAAGFDVALIDGGLLYRGGLEEYSYLSPEESGVVDEVASLTVRAFETAWETNTPLVGVLKRSYSRDLAALHGLRGVGLSDRVLMTMILEEGEYHVAGDYVSILRGLKSVFEKLEDEEGEEASLLRSRIQWLESIVNRYKVRVAERVKIVFYKPRSPRSLAVKAEVYEPRGWRISEVVEALMGSTGSTGFPIPLDYVDQMASITPAVRQLVYDLVKSKLSARDAELAEILMKLVNPQKPA